MISKFEIKGFKSLVDVSIELGAVNVFIGANGSGKSNLLEAVGFLSAIIHGNLEDETLRYRGVRQGTPASFSSSLKGLESQPLSVMASNDRIRYSVQFEPDKGKLAQWSICKETGEIGGFPLFSRDEKKYKISLSGLPTLEHELEAQMRNCSTARTSIAVASLVVQSKRKSRSIKTLYSKFETASSFLDEISYFAIFNPTTPVLRSDSIDIKRRPLGLGGSGLGQAIAEMLRNDTEKLGPFDLDDVYELIEWANSLETDAVEIGDKGSGRNGRPIRVRIGDRFMGDGHRSVSLLESSEGALYVLFLLALAGHEQSPKIFAIDNFDQALHPRLALALTRLISEQIVDDGSRQMLATTHNPLVLDGLDILDDRIRLFTVDRDSRGATRIDRVMVTEELMAQADKGLSLSRLWVMGRFGGVPKNI